MALGARREERIGEIAEGATERVRNEIGEVLTSEDIADAIVYAVTRPARMNVNELLVRPTRQRR